MVQYMLVHAACLIIAYVYSFHKVLPLSEFCQRADLLDSVCSCLLLYSSYWSMSQPVGYMKD